MNNTERKETAVEFSMLVDDLRRVSNVTPSAAAQLLAARYIYDGLCAVAGSIDRLGNGNAATQMGAIENLAVEIKEASQAIACAIGGLGE